jgi:hypothetical protein
MGGILQGEVARQTIGEIRGLSESMLETPEDERILVYRQLNRHFLTLEGLFNAQGGGLRHASDLLDQLKVHLIALARLDDPDQLTDDQHLTAAIETIEELIRVLGA